MNMHVKPALATLLLWGSILPLAQAAEPPSFVDLRLLGTSGGGAVSTDVVTAPPGAGGSIVGEVDDGLGWGLRGGLTFASRWQAYAEWGTSNTSLKVTLRDTEGTRLATEDSDFDLERIAVGLGYHHPLSDNWSVFGRLTWDLVEYGDFDEFDLEGFGRVILPDQDDSGVGATLGARWSRDRWDLELWTRYTSVGELVTDERGSRFDNDLGGGARVVYQFTDSLGIGADYELNDIDTWSVVFRYRF